MSTLVTIVHITTCALLILAVLVQSGKGAEISASFSGSSQTVFGSSGGANFFTRFTSIAAGLFMLTSIGLTVMASRERKSVMETAPISGAAKPAPAAPAAAQPPAPAAPATN